MLHSLPAILTDEHFRTAEACRLACEIVTSESPEVVQEIARYGQFVDNAQNPPGVAVKDFCLTVAGLRSYQETIAPLRDHRARLDDFDDKFALAVYRLAKK
jgi:hypothetical protein